MATELIRSSFCLLLLVIATDVHSQNTWVHRYSYSDTQQNAVNCRSVTAVEDGVVIIGSEEFQDDPTGWKLAIYKINWEGELVNATWLGAPWTSNTHGWANSADRSLNGGLINGGGFSVWATDGDPLDNPIVFGHLVKIDIEGNVEWEKMLGDSINFHTLRQVKATSDGGYIAVGQAGIVQYHPQIWVVKTDAQGVVEWQNYFGSTGPNAYQDGIFISETPSGHFVFGGLYDWQPFVPSGVIYRINSSGQLVNTANTQLGAVPNGGCEGGLVLENNDVIISTLINFVGEDGGEMRITRVHRLDPTLQNIWVSEVGENRRRTSINTFIQSGENSIVGAGTARTYDEYPLFYGHLTKMNLDDGSIEWQRLLNVVDNGMNMMFDVDHAPDGGFVTAGWCLAIWDDEFTGQQDAWVAKTDEHGCIVPGCHVGVLENEATAAFKLYPNPARDIVNLYLETDQSRPRGTITIHDLQGREVKNFPAPQGETTYIVDISTLPAGMYVVSYTDGVVLVTERLIVE